MFPIRAGCQVSLMSSTVLSVCIHYIPTMHHVINSYTIANEGLWNIIILSPKAEPEIEGGLYSIIP